jgi:hypothetical protein
MAWCLAKNGESFTFSFIGENWSAAEGTLRVPLSSVLNTAQPPDTNFATKLWGGAGQQACLPRFPSRN